MSRTLIVTGASGHLGRRVVELLVGGPDKLVAVTRHPEKLADLAARGVEVRQGDFDDLAGLTKAFAGGDRLLIVSTDDAITPGRRKEQHLRALEGAKAAKVGHIVYTSLVAPTADSPITLVPDHIATELAIAASGIPFTFLRNNLYADLLLGSAPQAVKSGQLVFARGEGSVSYVTREDCAQAAAGALRATTTTNKAWTVTGSKAWTGPEVAALLSELSGQPVAYLSVPPASFHQALVGVGLPAPVATLLVSFEVAAEQGFLREVSGSVRALGGRDPQDLRAFLTAHRAVFS